MGRGEDEAGWGHCALCEDLCFQPCDSSAFTVLAELRRCGLTDSETCLKSLTLTLGGGHMVRADPGVGGVLHGKRPLPEPLIPHGQQVAEAWPEDPPTDSLLPPLVVLLSDRPQREQLRGWQGASTPPP